MRALQEKMEVMSPQPHEAAQVYLVWTAAPDLPAPAVRWPVRAPPQLSESERYGLVSILCHWCGV